MNRYTLVKIISCIPALILSVLPVWAAEINVTVDRDPAVLNESFVLTFESDGDVDGDPDFSPLDRDFQILSTGESSNMSIINGRVATTRRWTLNVIARRTGTLGIPPIPFGDDTSTPGTVNVVRQAPGNTARNEKEIYLEVEATPENPYVQSEVVYKIRLYRAVATANASLSDPPEVTGATAVIEKLGDDRSYDTRMDGKLFSVIERQYAIYPQGSGNLTIEPVIFQGQVSRGSSFFSNPFGRQPRTVIVRSDPVSLKVEPVPESFTGTQWLPARSVILSEEWSEYPLEFEVDQPLTRTVTLTANGLTASQLPELPEWDTDAFKQYPDQPLLEEDKRQSGITGKRVEKIALIPNRPGTFTLPEITIPWWNTNSRTVEYATIPERQIVVTAAGQSNVNAAPDLGPPPLSDLDLPYVNLGPDDLPDESVQLQVEDTPLLNSDSRLWQIVSLVLLLLWLLTISLWARAKKTAAASRTEQHDDTELKQVIREFKRACMTNQPLLAKEKLLAWGRLHWLDQPPASAGAIAQRCGGDMAFEIQQLNNALYSRRAETWDGSGLWRVFEQQLKRSNSRVTTKQGKLEPLFKIPS